MKPVSNTINTKHSSSREDSPAVRPRSADAPSSTGTFFSDITHSTPSTFDISLGELRSSAAALERPARGQTEPRVSSLTNRPTSTAPILLRDGLNRPMTGTVDVETLQASPRSSRSIYLGVADAEVIGSSFALSTRARPTTTTTTLTTRSQNSSPVVAPPALALHQYPSTATAIPGSAQGRSTA